MSLTVSTQRRQEIIDALRRGTVPARSLDTFAVGLERFEPAVDEELALVARGGSVFKAVRGEYGSGKTFFSRWLQERAKRLGFAAAEVQISETETPLHRLETVYRRLIERMSTADVAAGALKSVVDGWFFTLEQDVLAEGGISEDQTDALVERTSALMERRLATVTERSATFALALRAYREAAATGKAEVADGLLAWLGGQPNVGADAKRAAGLKGDLDHFTALSFVQGLLAMLRDSGHPGLLVVLDEVETLQRVRGDVRDRGLNALRQFIDEIDGGRFPGLYLVITGTPSFYDGPQGVQRLPPLAQRLHTDFATHARFDNPRAVQIRLSGFTLPLLEAVGRKVRDIYAAGATGADRVRGRADDAYLTDLANAVTGSLGGKVGVAPRLFLKKLVGDVLDRLDQFPDFDPRAHYALTIADSELTDVEREAREARTPDDVKLDL
jgi:hypothetical protein